MGKDVTEVRSPHRTLLPDTVGPAPHEPTSLRGRANKARADKPHRLRDLSRCLDAHLLRACGDDLKRPLPVGWIHVTAERLGRQPARQHARPWHSAETQRYRAKLVRRCDIPKANGRKGP